MVDVFENSAVTGAPDASCGSSFYGKKHMKSEEDQPSSAIAEKEQQQQQQHMGRQRASTIDFCERSAQDRREGPFENNVTQGLHRNNTSVSRRRAVSVASTQPSVETVIVKAKRAAETLWLLLHAQNCVLAAGKCPHAGCRKAKLLHLHLKTCVAAEGQECPVSYHGCDQARKLLAHYRRCRSIRARQQATIADATKRGGVDSSSVKRNHTCLLCSLVARQAHASLKRTTSNSCTRRMLSSTENYQSIKKKSNVTVHFDEQPQEGKIMPPPPPRWQSRRRVASEDFLRPQPKFSSDMNRNGDDPATPCRNDTMDPVNLGLSCELVSSIKKKDDFAKERTEIMGMDNLVARSAGNCETIVEESSSQSSKGSF